MNKRYYVVAILVVTQFLRDNIIQVDTFSKWPPNFDVFHWVAKIEIRECSLGRPQLPTLQSGSCLPAETEDCFCQWKHLEIVRGQYLRLERSL